MLKHKLEAIGFGFLVPIFFISSGIVVRPRRPHERPRLDRARPDLPARAAGRPRASRRCSTGNDLRPRDQLALAFYSATSLPIIVAITTIAVDRPQDGQRHGGRARRGGHALGADLPVRRSPALPRDRHRLRHPWARRRRSPWRPEALTGTRARDRARLLRAAARAGARRGRRSRPRARRSTRRHRPSSRAAARRGGSMPEQHARDRIERRGGRDRELEAALQGDLGEPEGGAADGRERVDVPVEDDRLDAVADQVDRGLGERGGESEQDAGGRAQQRRAQRRADAQRDQHAGMHTAAAMPPAISQLRTGASLLPPEGSISARKTTRPPVTRIAPTTSRRPDSLARQARPQRQREHDAHDLDRLHDDQPPETERDGLHARIPPARSRRPASHSGRCARRAMNPASELGVRAAPACRPSAGEPCPART